MNDLLISVQVLETDNNKVRSLFDIIRDLLTDFDCSKKTTEAVIKFTTHLDTLVNFGEHVSSTLDRNISKLWRTLQRQSTELNP